MQKCLSQKRLSVDKAKVLFLVGSAILSMVGWIDIKFIGNIGLLIESEDIHIGGVLIELGLVFVALNFYSEAIDYFEHRKI